MGMAGRGSTMNLPTKTDVDDSWNEYQDECDRLATMRLEVSTSTELEIQIQLQLTEKLLQKWVDSAELFQSTLN